MPGALRVLTYNVHQLRDDASAVAEVIRELDPDVVALQEPPRGPSGRSKLRRLAHAAGCEVAVAGGGARTTALLVREGTSFGGARRVRLRWRPGRTRRGLAVADVGGLRVVSVHFSLVPKERLLHVDRLLRVVASSGGAGCVVAGDLNEEPDGETWRRLRIRLRDVTAGTGPTFTSRRPARRIDAVLATSGLVATRAQVLRDERTERASDHLPVVVDLRWD